jgi:Flp pilus assembly protein TadD
MGETEEALTHIARALRSSPTDPHLSLWVRSSAIAHFLAGHFDAAIQSAQEAIAKRNDWFFNHYLLAACQAANGELDSAYATMAVAKSMKAEYTLSTVLFGHPFHKPEDRDSFLAALRLAGWSG